MKSKILSVESACFHINKSNPPELAINAIGTTNSSGWKNGELIPYTYVIEPQDGVLDFDFVALQPNGIVLLVLTPIDAVGEVELENWVKGIRIHSSSNSIEIMLDDNTCLVDFISSYDGNLSVHLNK